MTEKLKTLMDEAAAMDFATPDLDTIYRDGDRTVRRRRLTVGAAGLAAAAVAVAGVTLVVGDDAGEGIDAAGDAAPVDAITWSWDQTLHTADGETYDLGRPIDAYVRTSAGYAFTDGEGTVYSFVDGLVAEIGPMDQDHPRLFADPEGSLVGWVDGRGDARRFIVHDLADGSTETFGDPSGVEQRSELDRFTMYAIDGRTAYVQDARGALAVDVDSGDVRVIEADPSEWFSIKGVEDGVIAFTTGAASSGSIAGTVLGTSPDDGVELFPGSGGPAYFSPDGRFVSLEGEEPEVYDAATGERVAIDVDGRPLAVGLEWLDEDTLVVGAAQERGPLELLTCEVPSGGCEVAAPDLGSIDEITGSLAAANGVSTDD